LGKRAKIYLRIIWAGPNLKEGPTYSPKFKKEALGTIGYFRRRLPIGGRIFTLKLQIQQRKIRKP